MGSEGAGRNGLSLLAKAGALDLYSLPALVVTTDGADVVRTAHCAALRAASQAGELQRQVAATFALSRLGITFLWQWGHGLDLPFGFCIR